MLAYSSLHYIFRFEASRDQWVRRQATNNGTADLLPPHLLYQGKIEACHPKVEFPEGWDIWHSDNHWSNESTMLRYAQNVLIPYVNQTRDDLDLPLKQPALAIFDVFAAHRVDSFIKKLTNAGIKIKFIPGGCTGELQPLDLSGNAQMKDFVKTDSTTGMLAKSPPN